MLERRRSKDYGQRHLVEKASDEKVLQVVKFLFENGPTELFREQLASIVNLIPALKLCDTDEV
jgi:hypothetical protein